MMNICRMTFSLKTASILPFGACSKALAMSPAQAPTVKVINLSIGDTAREFIHTPSPWARVIDWLAYHYRVLFCISAGNYCDTINIGLTQQQFAALSDGEKISATVKAISNAKIDFPASAFAGRSDERHYGRSRSRR